LKLFGKNISVNNAYTLTSQDAEFLQAIGVDTNNVSKNALSEVTYFVCIKHLSESIGKLPLKLYTEDQKKGKERYMNKDLDYILNIEPNPYMTASTFWQTVEFQRNHNGNAFVYIERQGNKLKHLWILPYNQVTIYIDDAGVFNNKNGIWYLYTDTDTGKSYTFTPKEILHFRFSVSENGLTGLAVKDVLKTQINTAQHGQSYLNKLYKGNMFGGKVILQYTGDLNDKRKTNLIKNTERYANSVGTGKFLPIPQGITATPMEMKLADAEFSELNKLSALQVASAFGIKPNILNNYEKSSYSNSETQQLDYYINSLLPTLKQYSEELIRKQLIYVPNKLIKIEHDIKALFKLDPVKQMNVLKTGINNFMYTINDVREELGKSHIDDPLADIPIGNGNYITLDKIGSQWN